MKINGIRMGFANNSSSSHSVIVGSPLGEFGEGDYYGWDDFLLRSRERKDAYLACQLLTNMRRAFSEDIARAVLRGVFGPQVVAGGKYDGGIDHQSVWDLPYTYSDRGYGSASQSISLPFFEDLRRYVLQDGIQIAGGNDNEDGMDYGPVSEIVARIPRDWGYKGALVCRRDRDHWVLFNKKTGAKVRLSFVTDEPYTNSSTPEMVDLKITDFCPFGCKFCYQGSTVEGRHAGTDFLKTILSELSSLEVFEVALGGGETTMHPDFAQILWFARDRGICPNFTTFTMDWAKSETASRAVAEHATSFALSINSWGEIQKLDQLFGWVRLNDYKGQVSVQCVLELSDISFFQALTRKMRELHFFDLTLLGHKSWGRDAGVKKAADPGLLRAMIRLSRETATRLAVDTVIAEGYAKTLDDEQIPRLFRVDAEGRFSMYIDAVRPAVARHSYCGELIPFAADYHGVRDAIAANFPFTGARTPLPVVEQ